MSGCPCEPNGTDGLTCPDKDGRLLCQTSQSRARPSDRAIAQAFWESRGATADCDWIAVRARQLDSEGTPVERWTSDDEVRYLLGLIEEHGDGESEYSLRAQHMMADIRRRLRTQPETPEARAGDCLPAGWSVSKFDYGMRFDGPPKVGGATLYFAPLNSVYCADQVLVELGEACLTTKATP